MRRSVLSLPTRLAAVFLLALAAATAQAQPIVLAPAGGPPGGSADAVLALDGGVVLLVQDGRVFRSADAGMTWARVLPSLPFRYERLTLRRGADGAAYVLSSSATVWRSTDGGVTWADVTGTDLRAAFAFRSARHGWFASTPGDTSLVLRSLDEGRSWQPVRAGIRNGSFSRAGIARLTTNAAGDVFAAVNTGEYLYSSVSQVYEWQPDSLRWTQRLWAPGGSAGFAFDAAGNALALSAGDREWYGNDGAHASSDGGRTWRAISLPCTPHTLRAMPDGRLWAGTSCGAFAREGEAWRAAGPGPVPVGGLDAASDGTAYVASSTADYVYGPFGRGLYRRATGATDWVRIGPRGASPFVLALSADARAVATTGGVWGGQENDWTPVPSDTLNGTRYGYATPIATGVAAAPWGRALVSTGFPALATGAVRDDAAAEPNASGAEGGNGIVAVGDSVVVTIARTYPGGLRRSPNRGRSFVAVDSLRNAYTLTRRADGRLFAAGQAATGSAARLWTSADTGRTWTRLPTPAVARSVSDVAARDGTQTLYLVARLIGAFEPRLFRSDDGGQTWREAGPARSENLVVEPRSGWLFAPSNAGLSVSRDEGQTWETLVDAQGGGFFPARATPGWTWPLAFDATGRLVTAASDGGLLRSASAVAADDAPVAAAASALRVWPNPAPGAVRIDAGTPDRVAATVHDVLGRVVARIDGPGDALAWDASASAPGVYVVRVVMAGGRVETARVVVAR